MIRTFICLNAAPLRWLAAALCALTLNASAATAAPEPSAPAAATYTTKAGDTVERLLKNTMADSPLNAGVLRKALADANSNVVTGKAGQKFKPGTIIHLPEHSTLDALLKTLARPDLQAQWRGMQLSMAQLTPEAISRALASALGAEVWLSRGQSAPNSDPKLLLRKLIQALQSPDKSANTLRLVQNDESDDLVQALSSGTRDSDTPAATFAQLQHAFEEMESAQVQAVQAQAQREVLFRMTLPFVDAEPVELVFRREPRNSDQLPLLTVNVHSRSETYGPVWLKTQLEGSQHIDLTMWAEKADVASTARLRSSELGLQLQQAGLNMRSFQIVHGARPEAPADFTPTGRGLVVDMSA